MARATVGRTSWMRKSSLKELVVNEKTYVYWSEFNSPSLSEQAWTLEHTVRRGDRLDLMATEYLGDPGLWWVIADANNLSDPISQLYTGLVLKIPDRQYVLGRLVR